MDLAAAIRTAIVGNGSITTLLPAYGGSYTVFTRRPVPDDAASLFPVILVSPDIALVDQDGVNYSQNAQVRDVAIYGRNDRPSGYRDVETIAYAVRTLFHRQRTAITPGGGWSVIDIIATGPIAVPTDEEQTVGRVVTLTVRLTSS